MHNMACTYMYIHVYTTYMYTYTCTFSTGTCTCTSTYCQVSNGRVDGCNLVETQVECLERDQLIDNWGDLPQLVVSQVQHP